MSAAIHYSRGSKTEDNTPTQRVADDFAQFRDLVLSDQAAEKGRQWIAGPCAIAPADELHIKGGHDGSFKRAIGKPHRCMACVRPRRFFSIDLDKVESDEALADLQGWLTFANVSAFGWTTHSHKPDKIRARFIIEADRDMDRDECMRASSALRNRINGALGGPDALDRFGFDDSMDRPEQPIYLPPKVGERWTYEGVPVCVDELLESAPAPRKAPATVTGQPVSQFDSGQVIETERHSYIRKRTLMFAAAIKAGYATRTDALVALFAERDAGKYSRSVPDDEIVRALDGALAKMPERAANDGPAELRLVPLTEVMTKEPKEWPHVVRPYFPRRVATLLAGHGGVGKSMLALTIAAHVAPGRPWGPFEVEQGKAVFLSFEDEGDVVESRLRRIIDLYGLPPALVIENLTILDGSDAEAEMAVENGGALEFTPMLGEVERAIAGADFVVIDNASDTFGGNENERRQVKRFVRRLSGIARANGAAIVLLAHVDKQAAKQGGKGNNFSGSTAWHNSVRSRLALVEADGIIELLHEKANFGPRHEPLTLGRGDAGVLEPVSRAVAEESRTATAALVADADAKTVLEVIQALIANRIDIPTAETGQRTTYHVLTLAPEMPGQFRSAQGKARIKAAVMALERSGRICREAYKRDRKDRERWTLAHLGAQEAA